MRFSSHHLLLVVVIAASCAYAGFNGREALVRTLRSQGLSVPQQLTQIKSAPANPRRAPTAPTGRSPGLPKSVALGRALAGTGSISGMVYDHDGVTPASSINFLVVDTFGYNVGVNNYTSNGSYSAVGLYPGNYTIVVAEYDSGYYFGNTFNRAAAQWIRVNAGQQVTGRNIVLPDRPGSVTPALNTILVTISGTCFAGASTPMANAFFSIHFLKSNQVTWESSMYPTTDAQGTFSESVSLDSGASYYAMVRMPGMAPLWFDGSSVSGNPSRIVIASPSISNLQYHFTPGATIGGAILDPQTDTLRDNVTINVIDAKAVEWGTAYLYPGDTAFAIGGLPAGSYYLALSSSSGAGYAYPAYYPSGDSFARAVNIPVAEGQEVNNIRWTLPRADPSTVAGSGTITGKVTLPGGAIAASGDIISRRKDGNPYADYAYSSIYGDTFNVSVEANIPYTLSFTPPAAEYYVATTYYANTTSPGNATPVTVAEGGRFTANIQAQPGGSIAGLVVDAQGRPVGDILKTLSDNVDDPYWYYALASNTSDSSVGGSGELTEFSGFRVPSLPPGTYDVRLIPMLYASGTDAVFDFSAQDGMGLPASGSVRKTVTAGQTTIAGPLALSAASGIIAGAFDGSGSPSASAVEMMLVDGNGNLLTWGLYFGSSYDASYSYILPAANARDSALYGILGYNYDAVSEIGKPPDAGRDIIHFALPGLPTGDYYLASINFNFVNDDTACVTWYGADGCAAFNYDAFLRVAVPSDAVAIHVTDGQTTANINFGPGSGARQRGALAATAFGLKKTGTTPRGIPVFAYTTSSRAKPAELSVYSVDGRRVSSITLAAESGTVAWDGKDAGGRAASAGCYLFCLTSGDQRAVVRANVVR